MVQKSDKNNFSLLNSILKKDNEEKVEEAPVTAMETDVVVSEPMIISDNVDLKIDNQCIDIETVEQILDNSCVVIVHSEFAEKKQNIVNKLL